MAAVAVAWLVLGGDAPSVSLEDDPGIPPPEYAYLDNPRVLAYLAQIEGGLSASEKRTRRVTATRNAAAAAGGISAGASAESEAFVEAVVTPTATTYFYRLLDRLGDKGYLTELDASTPPAEFARALGAVAEGEFVRISGCRLRLPTYVQMQQVIAATPGPVRAFDAFTTAASGTEAEWVARATARAREKGAKSLVGRGTVAFSPEDDRRQKRAAARFAAAIPGTARVPLSTCTGGASGRPDLLLPVGLDGITTERTLLAGPVTVVGKVVRQVKSPEDAYVDREADAAYSQPVAAVVDAALDDPELNAELAADVAVLPPGAVILPLAIYK